MVKSGGTEQGVGSRRVMENEIRLQGRCYGDAAGPGPGSMALLTTLAVGPRWESIIDTDKEQHDLLSGKAGLGEALG